MEKWLDRRSARAEFFDLTVYGRKIDFAVTPSGATDSDVPVDNLGALAD